MKKLFKIGVLLFVVVLLCFTMVTQISAYSFTGHYWNDPSSLYVYIPDSVSIETWSGFYNAINLWNSANTPAYFTITTNPLYANMVCDEHYYPDAQWSGCNSYNPIYPGVINSTECCFNTYRTYYNAYYGRVSTGGHELGHTLGLDEYSGQYLMEQSYNVRYLTYYIYSPTSDDISGVETRYP